MHQNKHAFTLIELLVVLVIIATIGGIAIPVSIRVQVHARAGACTSNLRGLGVALNLYLQDNNNRFPTLAAGRASTDDPLDTIDTVLLPHVDSTDIFRCPGDDQNLFQDTGTSYFWNSTLNGQHANRLNFLGLIDSNVGIPVISDKENFHRRRGDEVNILYADGHVDKEVKFSTGP